MDSSTLCFSANLPLPAVAESPESAADLEKEISENFEREPTRDGVVQELIGDSTSSRDGDEEDRNLR